MRTPYILPADTQNVSRFLIFAVRIYQPDFAVMKINESVLSQLRYLELLWVNHTFNCGRVVA